MGLEEYEDDVHELAEENENFSRLVEGATDYATFELECNKSAHLYLERAGQSLSTLRHGPNTRNIPLLQSWKDSK
ncbi:hypothetical protein FHG87_013905 [Trinorchestia longiramus]|nr:hypothetical protein FHG87_013905 [Trinorchestia longiramus]